MKFQPRLIAAGLVVAIAISLVAFPPAGLSNQGAMAAALCLAVIGLLATAVLPEFVTALVFFVVAILLAIAPPEVVFSGFHSTPFWLVFGGLVIGIGVRRTGLATRLAAFVSRPLSARYTLVIAGVIVISVGLAFVMPATMGRLMVLMPIVLALAEALGFRRGSNGYTGMVLAMPFATMIPGFAILPATVPAVLAAGMSETLYGIQFNYASYLWLHFPVLGLLKAIVIWAAVVLLFPDTVTGTAKTQIPGPAGRDERYMGLLLILALILWLTDFWHGISPAWIALAVATIVVMPFMGLVSTASFHKDMNIGTLVYLAGVLGVGAVLAHSDADDLLAQWALQYLPFEPGEGVRSLLLMAGLGTLIAALATQPSAPLILTPLAADIADASGLPLEKILMMQVLGFSSVLLPYQTPPLVVGMQIAGVPLSQGIKLCLVLFVVTILVLIPLDILWWKAIGWLP